MEIKLTLALPRDSLSIPVVRRTLVRAMEVLGVDQETTSDIQLAITEACTNVLDHAVDGDEYEVSCGINEDVCVIEVVDRGRGFDAELLGHVNADHSAEEGRGIQLMRALMDTIRFDNRPERGTIVHLEKKLAWVDDAPVVRLRLGAGGSGPWESHDGLAQAPRAD